MRNTFANRFNNARTLNAHSVGQWNRIESAAKIGICVIQPDGEVTN
jgi:hypothetical protein